MSLRKAIQFADSDSVSKVALEVLDERLPPEIVEIVLRYIWGIPETFNRFDKVKLSLHRYSATVEKDEYRCITWFCYFCSNLFEEELFISKNDKVRIFKKISWRRKCCKYKSRDSSDAGWRKFKAQLEKMWQN